MDKQQKVIQESMEVKKIKVGSKIKYERERRGFTREDLCEQIDNYLNENHQNTGKTSLNPRTIERWEAGEHIPHASYQRALRDILDISIELFLSCREDSRVDAKHEEPDVPITPPLEVAGEEAVSSAEELKREPMPKGLNPFLLATKGRIAIAVAVVLVVAALFMVVVIKLSIPQLKAHYRGTATCDRGCDRNQMGQPLPVELVVNHQDGQGNITATWVYTDPGGHTYSCRGNVTRDNTLTLICTGGLPGWTLMLSGRIYPDGHLEGGLDGTNGSSSLHKTWTTHIGF